MHVTLTSIQFHGVALRHSGKLTLISYVLTIDYFIEFHFAWHSSPWSLYWIHFTQCSVMVAFPTAFFIPWQKVLNALHWIHTVYVT